MSDAEDDESVDDVVIEEVQCDFKPDTKPDTKPGTKPERQAAPSAGIPLPPNRPGLIHSHKQESGPVVKESSQLRRMAMVEAESVLPGEIEMRLSGPFLVEVVAMVNGEPGGTPADLWKPFAKKLVDLLWAPPCGCKSKAVGAGEKELPSKLQLFWRCAIALCSMPLTTLAQMSKRKRPFLEGLDDALPPEDAPAHVARLAHIRINLPAFAMMADMPKKGAPPKGQEAANKDATTPSAATASKTPNAGDGKENHAVDAANTQETKAESMKKDCAEKPIKEVTFEGDDRAAKHTYDKGYQKWDSFNVDKALKEVDIEERSKMKKTQKVDFDQIKKTEQFKDSLQFDDPLEFIDRELKKAKEKGAAESAASQQVVAEGQAAPSRAGEALDQSSKSQDSSSGANITAMNSPYAAVFKVGTIVKVHGLKSATDLNDLEGSCEVWDWSKGRWGIRLVTGELKSIQPSNLRAATVHVASTGKQSAVKKGFLMNSQHASNVAGQGGQPACSQQASNTHEEASSDVSPIVSQEGGPPCPAAAETHSKESTDQVSFELGSSLEIHGLTGSPELNGCQGVCEAWDSKGGRWGVRLQSGALKAIKPGNLALVQEGSTAPVNEASTAQAGVVGACKAAEHHLNPEEIEEFQTQGSAVLEQTLPSERPQEELTDGQGKSLSTGMAVRIVGLKAAPEMNGTHGVCEIWDSDAGRWGVRLDRGAMKALKPGNLEALGSIEASVDPNAVDTSSKLDEEYKKWETVEYDDMDDVSGDEEGDPFGLGDLDAISGPKDEVAKIKRHWKRADAARKKEDRERKKKEDEEAKARRDAARAAEHQLSPLGPTVYRPCEYRPLSDPEATSAKALDRDYNRFKRLDVDEICLGMDNEGKTQEGDALRLNSSPGSAMLMTENYEKDREEYDLDQELEDNMGNMKKEMAQRLKDGAGFKLQGNDLLRDGKIEAACTAYGKGVEVMDFCKQCEVLMSQGMVSKVRTLDSDLHRNLAQALLQVGEVEKAKECCDVVLKHNKDDQKALYRRASALIKLGELSAAEKDAKSLSKLLGSQDISVKRLQSELQSLEPSAAANEVDLNSMN